MTKIYSARWVLPITSEPFEDGAVAVEGTRVAGLGGRAEVASRFPSAEVVDFGEAAILPGFVNCHTHLELTAMRGFLEAEEGHFFAWLRKVTFARRFNRGAVENLGSRMGRSVILDGCGLALFSLMPSLWGAALVLVAREMNFAIWWTAQQTLLMKRTEDRVAGRVFASYETLTTLTMVGSILVCGEVADHLGIRSVAAGGGTVVILSGLLWFVLRRRGRTPVAETVS